jgi:superfamily II DNA/RNA helicase
MPALTPISDRDALLNDQNATEANDTVHAEPVESAMPENLALSLEQPIGRLGADSIDVPGPGMAAAEGRVPAGATEAEPEEAALPEADAIHADADEPEANEPEANDPQAGAAEPEPLPLFSDLGLSEPILRAIAEKGYAHPTPIQAQAIPAVLSGRDVMGVAQTGTGKTAGFTLPMLDILSGSRARARMPRSLILEPTRELALQVAENFLAYGKYLKLNHALLIGGESLNDQKDALMKGVDVLIATPGRLIDLFERGGLMLTDTKLLVIDEADRMLDMGFIPDVEKIVAMLPKTRQTLFFSATMAPEIRRLSDAFLDNPRLITVSRNASVATTIVAGLALVADIDKREALRRLIRSEDVQNALIFCNRKRDVDILLKSLTKHGFSVGALHGDMSQPARFATLEKFKQNELRLLVCSDVAARGIDIGGLSHVFNFDVPHHAEDYVHRIGRTGRAGKVGHAFTLATPEDKLAVEAIEKLTGSPIPPIAVEGLDVVAWAEGKRHGRGGKRGGPPPKRGRGSEPSAQPATAPAPEKPAARAPEPRRQPRPEERRPDRGPRPERSPRPEAERPIAAAPQPDIRSRSDYRRRDEDLGPSVQGFGDDIPAFMLLPWRRDRLPHGEADPEA